MISCYTFKVGERQLSWSSLRQTDSGTVKCRTDLPNLSALSRDAWPATARLTHHSTFYNHVSCATARKHTAMQPRCVSRVVVEAHFRDADNNQHRSFQGRETLPLIEDSCLRPPFVWKCNEEEFRAQIVFLSQIFNQTRSGFEHTHRKLFIQRTSKITNFVWRWFKS